MRQILYVSQSTVPGDTSDLDSILERSCHNNALDGLTRLLWSDGKSFMQVLEGPRACVTTTFARILADARHHSLVVLQERQIPVAEFSRWTVVHRRAEDPADSYDAQMLRLLMNASDEIRTPFLSVTATGHVAALALPVEAIGAPPPDHAPDRGAVTSKRPRRQIDRRTGAALHNVGIALDAAFPANALPAHAPLDECLEQLCSVARTVTRDSTEKHASQ